MMILSISIQLGVHCIFSDDGVGLVFNSLLCIYLYDCIE